MTIRERDGDGYVGQSLSEVRDAVLARLIYLSDSHVDYEAVTQHVGRGQQVHRNDEKTYKTHSQDIGMWVKSGARRRGGDVKAASHIAPSKHEERALFLPGYTTLGVL